MPDSYIEERPEGKTISPEEQEKLEAARRRLFDNKDPRGAINNFYSYLDGGMYRQMLSGKALEDPRAELGGKSFNDLFAAVDQACADKGVDLVALKPTLDELRQKGGLDPDREQRLAEQFFPVFEDLAVNGGFPIDQLKA